MPQVIVIQAGTQRVIRSSHSWFESYYCLCYGSCVRSEFFFLLLMRKWEANGVWKLFSLARWNKSRNVWEGTCTENSISGRRKDEGYQNQKHELKEGKKQIEQKERMMEIFAVESESDSCWYQDKVSRVLFLSLLSFSFNVGYGNKSHYDQFSHFSPFCNFMKVVSPQDLQRLIIIYGRRMKSSMGTRTEGDRERKSGNEKSCRSIWEPCFSYTDQFHLFFLFRKTFIRKQRREGRGKNDRRLNLVQFVSCIKRSMKKRSSVLSSFSSIFFNSSSSRPSFLD